MCPLFGNSPINPLSRGSFGYTQRGMKQRQATIASLYVIFAYIMYALFDATVEVSVE